MTVWPVIVRELRAESRHPFTYWLRVLVAAALLLVTFNFKLSTNLGGQLFGYLHTTLFWAMWIIVPIMTSDCISRERREGTLGLLFLTPLRARDVVIAKGLAHGLRALTLWIAALPVLTIPFLMGGVSWQQAVSSACIDFSSLCWALSAGLLASCLNKTRTRSLISAAIWSCFFFGVFNFVAVMASPNAAITLGRRMQFFWSESPFVVFAHASNVNQYVGFSSLSPQARIATQNSLLSMGGKVAILSSLSLLFVIGLAARYVRGHWQELPPSPLRLWWEQTFCTPVVMLNLFRRWLRRKLERNPVGWLQVRTWNARVVTWGWLAAVISFYSLALSDATSFNRYAEGIHLFMAWLLVGSVALTAAGSFRRERETGVLELLLVSPLGVSEIVNGRLRGLWGQFLPTVVLLLGVWFWWATWFPQGKDTRPIWFFGFTFATLPVIGLYFSLAKNNFISAFLWTLVVGLLLPCLLPPLSYWMSPPRFIAGIGLYRWDYASMMQLFFRRLFLGAAPPLAHTPQVSPGPVSDLAVRPLTGPAVHPAEYRIRTKSPHHPCCGQRLPAVWRWGEHPMRGHSVPACARVSRC